MEDACATVKVEEPPEEEERRSASPHSAAVANANSAVAAASADTKKTPSPKASSADSKSSPLLSPSALPMDTNITLWQFLYELLQTGEHNNLIQWTTRDGEFKLHDAEAVARLWGVRKAKPNMNYDKLSRALRYYYDKNIIKKVNGQKFVYRFVGFPDSIGKPSPGSCSINPSSAAGSPSDSSSSRMQPMQQHLHHHQQQPLLQRNEQHLQHLQQLQQMQRVLNAQSMMSFGGVVPSSSAGCVNPMFAGMAAAAASGAYGSAASASGAAGGSASSLASAVHAGILSGITSTPSPSNESAACSPNSVGSHSSTSGSSSSAALTPPNRGAAAAAAAAGAAAANSSSSSLLSPPGPSHSPLSENGDSRKRKAPSGGFDDAEDVKPNIHRGFVPPPLSLLDASSCSSNSLLQLQQHSQHLVSSAFGGSTISAPSSCTYTTASMHATTTTPTSGGGLASRRARPEPLNLSQVSSMQEGGADAAAAAAAAGAAPPTAVLDTPSLLQVFSPMLMQHNGSLVQMMNSLLSASLYGPNSPLAFASPLFGPPVAAAAAAAIAQQQRERTASAAAEKEEQDKDGDAAGAETKPDAAAPALPTVFQFPSHASPLHSSLMANLFSPMGKTPTTSTPVFQFPSTAASVAASMASLLSPATNPLTLTSVFAHRYLGDDLKTPTATLKTPSHLHQSTPAIKELK